MDTENRHYKLTTLIDGSCKRDDADPVVEQEEGSR